MTITPSPAASPSRREPTSLRFGRTLLGAGLLAFGVQALRLGGFIANWEPVPKTLPLRWLIADLNAAVLIVSAALLLAGWRVRSAALGLTLLLAVWIVAMHARGVIAHPLAANRWLGVAEVGAMASASAMLAAMSPVDAGLGRRLNILAERGFGPARFVFGLCLLMFGASHFIYAGFTAQMVPAWLPPSGLFWAYLTGGAHVAAGLATLSSALMTRAAQALAAMFLGFIVLVHLPRVVATHGDPMEVVFLTVASILLGAACVLWAAGEQRERLARA